MEPTHVGCYEEIGFCKDLLRGFEMACEMLNRNCRALTNSVGRENPFGPQVRTVPFHFDQPKSLVESLRGMEVLSNTYWVRGFTD